nr:MobF family relaxase [Nostoc flagelliforme]
MTAKNASPQRAVEYFLEGYYQEGESRWYGKGAKKLKLSGAVNNKETFSNIVNGRSPDGSRQLSARTLSSSQRRAASDFTFSAPKSVSLMALVAGDQGLIKAHQSAVEQVLALIEERYACTRVTTDSGREIVNTGNLVVAEFDHIESRELDPHLHTHALVMNMTEVSDGEWYSTLNDDIFANKKFLGMAYQSYLAVEVQKLGYEVEAKKHGQFEIKGFKEEDLKEFSLRRQQILGAIGENSNWAEREKIWSSTRKRKEKIDPEDLKAKWKEEAAALGITFVQPAGLKPEFQALPVTQESLEDAIAHCSERNVAFTQSDLEKFILSQGLATDVRTIEPLIKSHPDLISLSEQHRDYTTLAAVQREIATIRLMQQGQGKVNVLAHPEFVDSHLEKTALNSGQRRAVLEAATTTDQFIAWQGVAGAGKTFALRELKAIAVESGYTIKGFAPSSMAAKVLGEELDIQAETVARLLVSEPPPVIQPNQIWVVDEAGLLSAAYAMSLLERATQEQARVILVGDTRQLSAVEAGNPFKSLQQAGIKTSHLNESLRQRAPELKLAVDLIAEGRIEEGFERLDENGCIQSMEAELKIDTIARDYMAATKEQRARTLVLAGTNRERLQITQAIREQLKAEGSLGAATNITQLRAKDLTRVQMRYTHNFELGDVVMPTRNYKRRGLEKGKLYSVVGKDTDRLTLITDDGSHLEVNIGFDKAVYQRQGIEIAVGDRLRWTKNDRQLGRRNGQEFVVKAIEGYSAQIQYLDNGRIESISLAQAQCLDYAIVSTTYSSQGKTADRVLIAADNTIGQESFYVAVSRARYELKLYTEDKSNLLSLAQSSRAKENALALVRQKEQQRQYQQAKEKEKVVVNAIVTSKPENILLRTGERLRGKGQGEEELTDSSFTPDLPLTRNEVLTTPTLQSIQSPIIKQPSARAIQTEAFWTPSDISSSPNHIELSHWQELVKGSAIHPEIVTRNFKSLQNDPIEHEHEAWEYLMYSDKLERSNTGRLSAFMLRKYAHLENGGWWCNAGVDPRSFLNLQSGQKPEEKIWGCYKPNAPRENPDKPGKFIKYEHPPKTDLSIFLIDVPDYIAERIYDKAGVQPTQSDRQSGFWYCVWKHNIPVSITEGAKKAASLLSQGYAAIGLPGIYAGYRSKDALGNEIKARLHEELAIFATPKREMTFCFDYETRPDTKRNIDIAISRTGGLLERLGAKVSVVSLPGTEKGVDDFIVAQGGLAYYELTCKALRLREWRKDNQRQRHSPPEPLKKLRKDERKLQLSAKFAQDEQQIVNIEAKTGSEEIRVKCESEFHASATPVQENPAPPVPVLSSLPEPPKKLSPELHQERSLIKSVEDENSHDKQRIARNLNRFSDKDFLLAAEFIVDYFSTSASRPPSQADKHSILSEIETCCQQIDSLWIKHEEQKKLIESADKKPVLRGNKQIHQVIIEQQYTLEMIRKNLKQKEQFEQQLSDWEKQSEAHQKWLNHPDTIQFQVILEVLKTPQMLERLANTKQESQQQKVRFKLNN